MYSFGRITKVFRETVLFECEWLMSVCVCGCSFFRNFFFRFNLPWSLLPYGIIEFVCAAQCAKIFTLAPLCEKSILLMMNAFIACIYKCECIVTVYFEEIFTFTGICAHSVSNAASTYSAAPLNNDDQQRNKFFLFASLLKSLFFHFFLSSNLNIHVYHWVESHSIIQKHWRNTWVSICGSMVDASCSTEYGDTLQ